MMASKTSVWERLLHVETAPLTVLTGLAVAYSLGGFASKWRKAAIQHMLCGSWTELRQKREQMNRRRQLTDEARQSIVSGFNRRSFRETALLSTA
jgi:hypothetical protein